MRENNCTIPEPSNKFAKSGCKQTNTSKRTQANERKQTNASKQPTAVISGFLSYYTGSSLP